MTASDDWPFEAPRNVAVFTVKQILERELPILEVSHDADDGAWQFLTGLSVEMEDAKLVCLSHIVELDSSIVELANLPEGWEATRTHVGAEWQRRESVPDEDSSP